MAANHQAKALPDVDSHNLEMLISVAGLLNGKQIHEFSIPEQRELFRKVQEPAAKNPGVAVLDYMVQTSYGEVKTFLYKPESTEGDIPLIYFIHGGGWIFGSAFEWETFLFDLVMRTGMAVVFPEYTLAPERKYPAQQEQCLEVLEDVLKVGSEHGLLVDKVVIASDSVGGQLASTVSILNQKRSLDLPIVHQIMLHPFINTMAEFGEAPVTSAASIDQYFTAYFSNEEERRLITASPGLMTPEQAKLCMPPTTIVTSEVDGLRDQAEDFAKVLHKGGVPCGVVRAVACLHDFEIFNASRGSPTASLIMTMISEKLREVLG